MQVKLTKISYIATLFMIQFYIGFCFIHGFTVLPYKVTPTALTDIITFIYRTIVKKFSSNTSEVFYQLQIVPTGVSFTYRSITGVHSVTFTEVIPAKTWTHLALQVFNISVSDTFLFANFHMPQYS